MWLLEGAKAPAHNTIARFRRRRISTVAEDLFYQLVGLLKERGKISFNNQFVDGTKIEANANKYSFIWRAATEKQAAKLKEKLAKSIQTIRERYHLKETQDAEPTKILVRLHNIQQQQKISFVYGTGKRKSQLQRDIEELEEILMRQQKYEDYGAVFQGRNRKRSSLARLYFQLCKWE